MRTIRLLAALILIGMVPASAQDVAGVEDCTKTSGLDKRTGCLQANVNFLQRTMTRNALVLTDAAGIVLYERVDPAVVEDVRRAGLRLGADWSESRQGTNGMGTCIAEDRPIIVHRDEHFRACLIGLSCTAAPIHDASGALVDGTPFNGSVELRKGLLQYSEAFRTTITEKLLIYAAGKPVTGSQTTPETLVRARQVLHAAPNARWSSLIAAIVRTKPLGTIQ